MGKMCMKFVCTIRKLLIIQLLLPFVFANNVDYDDKEHVNSVNVNSLRKTLRIGDQPEHLLWFIQISDIHLSYLNNEERTHAFENFTTETIDTIKPRVVLASGDLTDGRGEGIYDAHQNDEEWMTYKNITTKSKVEEKTVWLDIRGNHDTFNAGYHSSNSSHFKRYSVQGGRHSHSYMRMIEDSSTGELYSFIAVDTTLEPGPKRTMNFLGMLTQSETQRIEKLMTKSAKADYTIWFGHYPTSCISTVNDGNRPLESLIGGFDTSLAYLCGHLHTFMGLSDTMYTLQRDKFLELEVADFKSCRRYRVAAIDHGLFSFVDVTHGQWPVILITNPKHSLFRIPHRRESKLQLGSTHIRILIFTPAKSIKKCVIQIDDKFEQNCFPAQNSTNLFVAPWNPIQYKNGLHYIRVIVEDSAGRVNKVNQPFRLDGQQTLSFGLASNFLLGIHFRSLTQWAFWLSLTITIAPLIFVRIWHELTRWGILRRRKRDNSGGHCCQFFTNIVQQYWLLSSVDRLFWPIIVYCIYIAVGPWMYCEVADNKYGLVFAWGIWIDGSYLYGSLTYLYGAFQLMCCQFPLIIIFSIFVSTRYQQILAVSSGGSNEMSMGQDSSACCRRNRYSKRNKKTEITFYVILAVEIAHTILLATVYDAIVIATSVIRTWSILLNIYLWYFSRKLPKNGLRSGIYAWSG